LKRSMPYDKVKGVSDIVLVEPQGSKRTL
jgi:sporulation protein YlmC with PRC-barrel domain